MGEAVHGTLRIIASVHAAAEEGGDLRARADIAGVKAPPVDSPEKTLGSGDKKWDKKCTFGLQTGRLRATLKQEKPLRPLRRRFDGLLVR